MNDKSQSERLFKVVDLITAEDAHNKQNVIMLWCGCQWCLSVFLAACSTFYWSPFVKFLGALKWKHCTPNPPTHTHTPPQKLQAPCIHSHF